MEISEKQKVNDPLCGEVTRIMENDAGPDICLVIQIC